MKNMAKLEFVITPILSASLVSVCMLLGAVFLGCSKAAMEADMAPAALNYSERAASYGDGFTTWTDQAFSGEAASPADKALFQSAGKSKKLVQRASLRIRVEDPEKAEDSLMAAMDTCNAYASSTSIYENSRSYTIRVPPASYKSFFSALSGMGKLLHRTENAEDVTLQFYDLEGQLSTKQELLRTFQSYLGRAQNIEEILSVEKRIAELQQEIEWTGTELRSLADLVDYATIDLTLTGPAGSFNRPGLGEKILDLFHSFGDYASTVLVTLIGIAVFGVPSILLLTLLFWLLFGKIGLLKKLWRAAAGKGAPGSRQGHEP
ncbi:MAG: DUF4349 domain-containing protein [Treponema sp.]|jgi:hypothetical protein|nr:DUF4349 domain-containing protein [Treponema sp.]